MLLASSSLLAQNMREEVRRARQVYRRHQYANAEVAYRKALSKDSTFTEARFGLAGTQYAQGRTDEALQNYAALVQDPTLTPKRRAELMHNLGNSFMKKKDYRQSVEAYKHSLRINPTDEETRYNLALAMKLLRNSNSKEEETIRIRIRRIIRTKTNRKTIRITITRADSSSPNRPNRTIHKKINSHDRMK